MASNPILAELAAAGYLIHVEHKDGMASVRIVEPKTQQQYSARGENEFMAAIFAKGKVDLGLADAEPVRQAA